MQCEGWRRYGGAFSFGPVVWRQCDNDAVVVVESEQEGEVTKTPVCMNCWNEGIETGIRIIRVAHIKEDEKDVRGSD